MNQPLASINTSARAAGPQSSYELDIPANADGQAIFRLVRQCPPLDLNSCYSYLLLCTHWRQTCVVARQEGVLAGFISAYIPPAQPDTLFIWQVAVGESHRGKGLALRMLEELLNREQTLHIRFMETTITPDNSASHALFKRFSDKYKAALNIGMGYGAEDFGDTGHLPELLYRIGPINH